MEDQGNLYITIKGKVDNEPLSPRNYDVREVMETLQLGLDILFGGEKRNRPTATYELQEGSVRHIFTTLATVAAVANAQLQKAQETGSLVGMEQVRAKAVLALQESAKKYDRVYVLGSSKTEVSLQLNKKSDFEEALTRRWYETEFYFYGLIEDWGGLLKQIFICSQQIKAALLYLLQKSI